MNSRGRDAPAEKEDLVGHQEHLLKHHEVWFSGNLGMHILAPHHRPTKSETLRAVVYVLTRLVGDSDATQK